MFHMVGASTIGGEPVRHPQGRKVCRYQNPLPLGVGEYVKASSVKYAAGK